MADEAASLKVFVSYSRADVAFADQLVLALEDKGFNAILDRHDISGAENWRERLGKLILSADAVAFILTAKSAASEICAWEVEEAQRLGKRIIPITPEALGEAKPPKALGELNWIPFWSDPAIPGSGFYYGVKRLNEALSVDLDWLRAQTRYSERALEWARDKREDLLLRGEALKEAEGWLARTPRGSHPPDLVREYLATSGDVEQHRQAAAKAQLEEREQALKTAEAAVKESRAAQEKLKQFSLWALVAGVILLVIAIPGNYFATVRTLDANDRKAAIFADAANDLSRAGDYSKALLMALAGDPQAKAGLLEDIFRPDGNLAVREALARAYASDRSLASVPTGSPATRLVTLPDGKRFLTVHEDGVRLWTGGSAPEAKALALPRPVKDIFPMPDGERLIVWWQTPVDQPLSVWSLTQNKELVQVPLVVPGDEFALQAASLSKDGLWLVTAQQRTVAVWNPDTGAQIWRTDVEPDPIVAVGASSEFDLVFASTFSEEVMTWMPRQGVKATLTSTVGRVIAFLPTDEPSMMFGSDFGHVGVADHQARLFTLFQPFSDSGVFGTGITAIRLDAEDRGIVAVSEEGQLRLWESATNDWSEPFGRRSDIVDADFLPALGIIAATTRDGAVLLASFGLNLKPTLLPELFAGEDIGGPAGEFLAMYMSQSGVIGLTPPDGGTRVWRPGGDGYTTLPTHTQAPEGQQVRSLAVSTDGETLAIAYDKQVDIWKAGGTAPAVTWAMEDPASLISEVRMLMGAKALMIRAGEAVTIINTENAERTYGEMISLGDPVPSPDGKLVATLNSRNLVWLWRAGAGKPDELKLRGDATYFDFSPDSSTLAVAMADGSVDLIRVGESQPFQSLKAHRGGATRVVFDMTGKLLATAGGDGRVQLWQVGGRDPLQTFDLPGSTVGALAIDAAARRVIAMDEAGMMQFEINPAIGASADEQVKMACARLEARGVSAFTPQDYLDYGFLGKAPANPCEKLGLAKAKPAP